MQLLDATPNPFNGIVINSDALPTDPQVFREQLRASLESWHQARYWVIWLEVPIAKSALIPIAVDAGFTFHHSGEDYLMLTHRIKPDALIPNHATHYIGAGGVVLTEENELLVVSELHRRQKDRPSYKLPGGALHPGEHLADAVVREVYEETGVQAMFERLVCLRHWHGYRFGKSDIYFICRLSPTSREITLQADEIEECLWMPVDDYLNSEYVHTFNKRIVEAALNSPGLTPTEMEGYEDLTAREFFMP